MNFFDFLTLIGGLALFLFGMEIMSQSLQNISGNQMKSMLENLTSNKLKGALLGTAITALIQSSSGTTVIVVGLVNSAVMTLEQAINVIMGANIGTTITAWLLSMTSISSDNFLIQMLKPSSFTPILAMVGVVFLMFSKDEKKNELGKVFLGFAVLIFGMETMSSTMAPLAEKPEFAQFMIKFENPILGILAGAVITAIIQSSSASVGILQSLALSGKVTYSVALPIIMGQNIGTCATALLATIGTKRNAKRAAIMHLLFNVLSAVIFTSAFYLGDKLFNFVFMDNFITPVEIALVHTIMNVVTTIILLPISEVLVKLSIKLIPLNEEDYSLSDSEFQKLDNRLLESPSIALKQCFELSSVMMGLAIDALNKAIDLFENFDYDTYEDVKIIEEKVDRYEDKLGLYMVKISRGKLTFEDTKIQASLLQNIGDFERMADHAMNVAMAAKEMADKKLSFSDQAKKELEVYFNACLEICEKTMEVYSDQDVQMAIKIEPFEEVIDYLTGELKSRHVRRAIDGLCTIEMGFILTDLTTNLERTADHCLNVSKSIISIYSDQALVSRHQDYLRKDSNEFLEEYRLKREKYKLPLRVESV